DLPQPLGPSRPVTEPRSSVKLTPLITSRPPRRTWRSFTATAELVMCLILRACGRVCQPRSSGAGRSCRIAGGLYWGGGAGHRRAGRPRRALTGGTTAPGTDERDDRAEH